MAFSTERRRVTMVSEESTTAEDPSSVTYCPYCGEEGLEDDGPYAYYCSSCGMYVEVR